MPSNIVASTMLKGGCSNTTLQYADVSSMTRTCGADLALDMFHAPGFDHDGARRRGDVLLFDILEHVDYPARCNVRSVGKDAVLAKAKAPQCPKRLQRPKVTAGVDLEIRLSAYW